MSAKPLQPGELEVTPGQAPFERELPRCAIVVLNLNGRHHLAPCFETLDALDYPRDRYEVVLVDNGSTDGSAAEMRRDHAWVTLIENPRNVGFSAGCNQGATAARDAEVLVFLNNDMRVEPSWLRHAREFAQIQGFFNPDYDVRSYFDRICACRMRKIGRQSL